MTLAGVLASPALTVPVAALLLLWLLWYWRRLGEPGVPASRRRIRRISTGLMLSGLPLLLAAMSVLDAQVRPGAWAACWVAVIAILSLVVAAAAVDVWNTLRLGRRERLDRIVEEAIEQARARRGAAG